MHFENVRTSEDNIRTQDRNVRTKERRHDNQSILGKVLKVDDVMIIGVLTKCSMKRCVTEKANGKRPSAEP